MHLTSDCLCLCVYVFVCVDCMHVHVVIGRIQSICSVQSVQHLFIYLFKIVLFRFFFFALSSNSQITNQVCEMSAVVISFLF